MFYQIRKRSATKTQRRERQRRPDVLSDQETVGNQNDIAHHIAHCVVLSDQETVGNQNRGQGRGSRWLVLSDQETVGNQNRTRLGDDTIRKRSTKTVWTTTFYQIRKRSATKTGRARHRSVLSDQETFYQIRKRSATKTPGRQRRDDPQIRKRSATKTPPPPPPGGASPSRPRPPPPQSATARRA